MKSFVIKQPQWHKFMPKMHQNTFGGRTRWGAYALLKTPYSRNGAYFYGKGGEGEDLLLRKGREGERSYF